MSWFGEQLSSFTGKISDFTKEILPDSGIGSSDDLASEDNVNLPPKHLLNLCKEKDAEISLLMNEKASLEKSIEELDAQHQEAIKELLHLKNAAVKENIALKEELTLQRENVSVKLLLKNFEHNYCPKELLSDENQSLTETMLSRTLKNFNLVNVIGILWKNFSEISINTALEWLKEQSLLLETQNACGGDSSSRNVINRINIYIEFLQLMSSHPKLFSHIIDEIATVIYFLLSNSVSENSHFSVPESINEQSVDNSSSGLRNERTDFSSQTYIQDFEHIKDLFSTTPRPFLCNNAQAGEIDSNTFSHSQHVQTDDENSVQNCDALIFELKQYIVHLEQDKDELQERMLELEEQASNLQQQLNAPVSVSSVFVQTENIQNEIPNDSFYTNLKSSIMQTDSSLDWDCNEIKIKELQSCIDTLEQEKTDLQYKIQELCSVIDKSTTSSLTQTDKYECGCNVHELEAGICILEQDKADLEEELCHLKSQLQKPVSSVVVQTEEDCNVHELEAGICILEQDKADLEEELSHLKLQLQKPVSSVTIQTDEDSNYYDLLQSEISNLQQLVNFHEKEYNDTIQELNENVNNLEINLKEKESIISDKENKIQSSELECMEYRHTIDGLTEELQQINKLKEELGCKENSIKEKEDVIHSLECKINEYKAIMDNITSRTQQTDDFINLQNELEEKESDLQVKENIIQLLQHEIQEHKYAAKNLQEELHEIGDLKSLKEEIRLKERAIQEKENMINFLQKEFETYKINSDSLKMQQSDEIENLKEELKSKEIEIQKHISNIKSLEIDVEQYKTVVDNLTIEAQQTTLVSVDTQTEGKYYSHEFHESKILELSDSMNEKEKEFIAMQNQSLKTINELQQNINVYEGLLSERESVLNSLKSELQNCNIQIKDLTDELNQLKESSYNKRDENQYLCNQHESEIEQLKLYLNDKEKEFAAAENNLSSSITNLREILQSKDLLIIDKEETIQTLKLDLDETKRNLKKYLNDIKTLKAKQDYAKDIDTMEVNDITMLSNSCNRCKSTLSGESIDNDLKNEVQVLQDKLKALEMDKNQLLCVLNEKTQECSSLKAEVHKLTNIVASEKQALYKLQQDNCLLKESRDNSDPELTKEAIQKLSGIIRDKDLEIESLKQKNVTLTTLIQDVASVPDHLQSLIEEKENLEKQIHVFKADRDKIMARYNTVDKDCRSYAAEVKKLQSALSEQKKKFDVLEQTHFSVAQQYEEKQKSLINTQNEMIALKQRVSDLEQQQVDIKEKYGELLNKFNSDTVVQISKDELDDKNSQIEKLTAASLEKDHLIQEKDCLIHDLSQQIKTLKLEHEQQQVNISNLQVKVDELIAQLKEYEAIVNKHENEKEALEMRFQDKNSELTLLKDMNERLNMSLKEKEFTIQSMTEKISSLSHYISSDHSSPDTLDINQILADSESMFSKAQSLYKERDETLLALNQSKQENQSLRNEIQRMKSSEIHLKKELERLRMHLLEIEENYTTEALKAEEREKELRDELAETKRRAEISNTAIVDTNQRASIQIASLQEQLSIIANQRDQALAQVSTLEDKVHQHSASVSKLQLVLEQMQRGTERKIKDAEKKLLVEIERQKQLYKELEEKLQAKEMQLEESTQALEAASRLSEQLDAKEEMIAHLKNELSKTESKIKSTAQEIDSIKSNTEGKVDRVIMKSLVLGYFSTPPGQKSEVVRLLARVLDFNQEEMEKAGIVVGRQAQKNEQRGIFSSIFSRLPSLGADNTPPPPEKSFTTLFVQFLENESQPIVPMRFPVEKMAQEISYKQHPSKKSPTPEKKNLSKSNPLLLDIDSAFPTFTPVPAIEYSQSPAPSILREVLE